LITVAVRPRSRGACVKSTPSRNARVLSTGFSAFSSKAGVDAFFASLTKICGTSFASSTV
jgi:hypothetical protein